MLGHLSCYACDDSWTRTLIDQEIQAYIEGHPELEERILSGEITDVDLGEVLCDGCEDYFNDESEAQAQDNPFSDDYQPPDDADDTDANYKSWLCETCGDPAYDCGCADDADGIASELEDAFDARADRFPNGRDPLTENRRNKTNADLD